MLGWILNSSVLVRLQAFPWVALARWVMHAVTVALLVWLLIQVLAPAPLVAPAMQTGPSTQFRIDQSAEARLLGVETSGGLTPPSAKILGVFASESGQSGAVVLSVEGAASQAYKVGQDVANGWTIERLTPNSAVLGRSGQRHEVRLPETQVDPTLMQRVN